MSTPTIPDTNIVAEDVAWMGGYLTLWYEDYESGACIARGHITASQASRLVREGWHVEADSISHEWRLPTWHTADCWDDHQQLLDQEPPEDVADMLDDCRCDDRAETFGEGPHIVWDDAEADTPGAARVTAFYASDHA